VSITKIREVPSELPNAHLYLDDVEEIRGILIEAYKKNPYRGSEPEEPTIIFETADSRMGSIEDLRELGGSTTRFTITVGPFHRSQIRFYGILNPKVEIYSLSTEDQWAIYSRIKAVFEHRQYRIKNVVGALPGWMGWSLWILLTIVTPNILPHLRHPIVSLTAYLCAGLPALYFIVLRPSRVSFVRSRERSKVIADARMGYLKTIVLLLIAGIIGGIVTKVVEHFISLWWPSPGH
jgi:hypothetical protein